MVYKEKTQYSPGEICDAKSKQDIQKTSLLQLLIVKGFIMYITLTILIFNNTFSIRPHNLFGTENSALSK
jgi:hypothetical protein